MRNIYLLPLDSLLDLCEPERMTIEQRIKRLEKRDGSPVPGTQITRYLAAVEGTTNWSLALGGMWLKKRFFYALTIEACLRKAEKELGIRKR